MKGIFFDGSFSSFLFNLGLGININTSDLATPKTLDTTFISIGNMMVDYVHLLMFLVFVLVHLPNKCALSTNHGHGAACVSLDAFFTLSKLKKGCSADSGLRILWTLDALPQVQTSKNQMPVYTVCVCVCSLLLGFSSRWKTFPF